MTHTEDRWIKNAIESATEFIVSPVEENILDSILEKIFIINQTKGYELGVLLAAAFDFINNAEYYNYVTNSGWCYCDNGKEQNLVYMYTNTCPICILENNFEYHPANKPPSGRIGKSTTRLLCIFLNRLFKKYSRDLKIYQGREPIDMLIYDEMQKIVMIAEVKAAPLITLPLIVPSKKLTQVENDEVVNIGHKAMDFPYLEEKNLSLMLPIYNEATNTWSHEKYLLDYRVSEENWAYLSLKNLIENSDEFFDKYIETWTRAYKSYGLQRDGDRGYDNIYWFTNACGSPSPRPQHWPTRGVGKTGYMTVSDGKTSVGMDRTDDIKKGIYQVLKLGAESKPYTEEFIIKTALISNIHAVRHHNEYLEPLQSIVWTLDETGIAKEVRDLPNDSKIYNLFDGIISFTNNNPRDEWVREIFNF